MRLSTAFIFLLGAAILQVKADSEPTNKKAIDAVLATSNQDYVKRQQYGYEYNDEPSGESVKPDPYVVVFGTRIPVPGLE
ncbi:hypothetical protein BCR43DRAFT_528087 [Syncephalastrum racemosum]|uniref:Uncharacterized protein n=1 Tax=Syncephalastrum racemosum TaxID=13706 RepID=A0A1X2H0D1_SYNRA|nr:hypothetical protein BCR43DRAFT_528087 [Syncephalastrum racemosum]